MSLYENIERSGHTVLARWVFGYMHDIIISLHLEIVRLLYISSGGKGKKFIKDKQEGTLKKNMHIKAKHKPQKQALIPKIPIPINIPI